MSERSVQTQQVLTIGLSPRKTATRQRHDDACAESQCLHGSSAQLEDTLLPSICKPHAASNIKVFFPTCSLIVGSLPGNN